MKELKDIVGEFEDSTRSNQELSVFIQEFGGYFINRMEEKDEAINELRELLKEARSIAKEALNDTSALVDKIKQSNIPSSRQIAERIFWEAMKS